MKIRLKGKQINTTIIQCYAPTNDSDEEAKDKFYDQLQAELNNTPGHDMKIVMGDMNAKVGNDDTGYSRAMGRQGCGVMNENGEKLLDFCSTYDFVIGRTLFPHNDIHKLTWNSPNGRDKNQIDHLMINGTWRHSLFDVRVMRGADVNSDHHLVVIAVVKVKLRKTGTRKTGQQQLNVDKPGA
ncbi:putative craniofacial development protein 2-like [Apostichopus japonicus]|uniref:Putative craniofacial development protein 2-like n=1 Tax=Stichopus japonicus TaxID=307972 RepID=A0A2G8K8B4_STIJA|nr:putative craniofacial development protein 2-like [Apostichopus japonicus]